MSDTPRTDAAFAAYDVDMDGVDLRQAMMEMERDAKSWSDQCSDRVKDWDDMRQRAERAEAKLARLERILKNPSGSSLKARKK